MSSILYLWNKLKYFDQICASVIESFINIPGKCQTLIKLKLLFFKIFFAYLVLSLTFTVAKMLGTGCTLFVLHCTAWALFTGKLNEVLIMFGKSQGHSNKLGIKSYVYEERFVRQII